MQRQLCHLHCSIPPNWFLTFMSIILWIADNLFRDSWTDDRSGDGANDSGAPLHSWIDRFSGIAIDTWMSHSIKWRSQIRYLVCIECAYRSVDRSRGESEEWTCSIIIILLENATDTVHIHLIITVPVLRIQRQWRSRSLVGGLCISYPLGIDSLYAFVQQPRCTWHGVIEERHNE